MRTVTIITNDNNQVIRIPKEFEFSGASELEIRKEGDVITLRPARPDWLSFGKQDKADNDFLTNREDIIEYKT